MTDLRILQVVPPSGGGIGRHVAQLTTTLDGTNGLHIDIAAPATGPIVMPKRAIPLTIPAGLRGHGPVVSQLRSILDEGAYEVVHAHGLRAGIDAARACRSRGIPVILTVHNLVRAEIEGRVRAALFRPSERLAVTRATRTFAVSEEIAAHLRATVRRRAATIEVLHPAVGDVPRPSLSRAEVRRSLGLVSGTRLVITVARLSPQKSVHVLIDALTHVKSDVVLAVAGEGPLQRELRDRARRAGVDSSIRWLGWRPDVANYVAAGDVFCLPSAWEGFPLAAQEAILLGIPLVVTNVGGMPELVVDGVSGRLVPHGDEAALAGALDEVLTARGAAARMAAAAGKNLRANFSKSVMVQRLARAYRDAAGGA